MPLLRDELLERARAKERQLAKDGIVYSTDPALLKLVRRDLAAVEPTEEGDPDEWLLEPAPDRIIVGREHDTLLEGWLETARSYVGIVSETLNASTVERLAEPLRAAVKRGVLVDVMWGRKLGNGHEDSHRKAFDLLKQIELDSYGSLGRGRLTLGRMPTRSNAGILFGDVSETFETVVGGHNWLSSDPGTPHRDLSLLFRELGPVVRIARLIADLADTDERLSTGVGLTRLRRAAEDLSRQTAEAQERRMVELEKGDPMETAAKSSPPAETPAATLRARIVVGRQHHAILPLLSSEARRRFIVASGQWGPDSEGAFRSLVKALENGCGRVEVRHGTDSDPGPKHDELEGDLQKLGGLIRHMPNLGARIAVADDDTGVVTSFQWLSPNFDRHAAIASDVGFVLRGNGIGSMLLDRAGIRSFDVPTPLDAAYITGFRIERLRSVNRIDWQVSREAAPGWHVLVGDNGSGKTSILRALALALIGSDNAQALRQDWSTWLRGNEPMAEVELVLQRIPGIAGPGVLPPSSVVKLVWEQAAGHTTLRGSPEKQSDVISAGYGPFRRFSGGDPEYERQLAAVPGLARHISLFDERVALTESLAWLRDLRFKALENDQESTLLLDRVTKLVNESGLLPGGVRLAQITSDAVIFRDEHDYQYGIEELSDGYRAVLSLTFDIVRQLSTAFGAARVFDHEQQHLVTAPAIVLIDEADAHLHPSWQRTVGQWFRHHFPRIQFIVSTHSPLICQAAESGSVYRLPDPNDESDDGGMLDGQALSRLIYGNILEAYASGAFGEGLTRSDSSKALLHKLADLNRRELTSGLSDQEQIEQEKLRATLPLNAGIVVSEDSGP